jgi:putative transposase
MRRSTFSKSDILKVLREQIGGTSIKEVSRRHGISERTFYRWKARWGAVEVSEAEKVRMLVEENCRLRKLLAESKDSHSDPESGRRRT